MSAATFAAIERAIAEHIDDERGEQRMVTGFVVIASHVSTNDDGQIGYWMEGADGQARHVTVGLAQLLADDTRRDPFNPWG